MPELGKFIYELKKKVEICSQTLQAAGLIKKATKKELADAAGIDLNALKSAYAKGRISREMELALAEACRFNVCDRAWCDENAYESEKRNFDQASATHKKNYPGHDTAANFRHAIQSAWKPLRLRGVTSADTDVSFALINISDSGNVQIPGLLCAFLQIDMQLGYGEEGYAFGFNSVYVRLISSSETCFEFDSPLGLLEPEFYNGLHIEARGTLEAPSWKLMTNNDAIQGRYWVGKPLIGLRAPAEGDRFDAEIRAQLFDGSLMLSGAEEAALGAAKKAIITRLMAKKITSSSASDGWIKLAKQAVSVTCQSTK